MIPYPLPPRDAVTISETESVVLSPGEKATVGFRPEQLHTTVYLPAVAISKESQTSYEIRADDSQIWQSQIPPTDIDDLSAPWIPVRRVDDELTVEIAYLASTGPDRTYHIQPIGWEV